MARGVCEKMVVENSELQRARKAKEVRDYLDRNIRIHLLIDSTRDGVVVPPHLMGDPGLCLLLNVRMPQRIDISPKGVSSVFSFSGQPFGCFVPLDAVWAVYPPGGSLDQGVVWPESVPAQVQQVMREAIERESVEQVGGDGSHAEGGESGATSAPEPSSDGGKRRKGHLRIV
ncbi:MAG: hypothetical protein Q9M26_02285 [Mariprofundales bacterium]|nr:hypothetical protein [Mariprofundales bacterium]